MISFFIQIHFSDESTQNTVHFSKMRYFRDHFRFFVLSSAMNGKCLCDKITSKHDNELGNTFLLGNIAINFPSTKSCFELSTDIVLQEFYIAIFQVESNNLNLKRVSKLTFVLYGPTGL